jgi:hypothetical protein
MEDQVRSHLIELSLSAGEISGRISHGKVSIRGFHCLQKLQLSVWIATCGIGIGFDGRGPTTELSATKWTIPSAT